MDKISAPADTLSVLRVLVSTFAEIFARRGVELSAFAQQWADRYLRLLGEKGAALEIEELLRAGCKKLPLAVVLRAGVLFGRLPEIHSETLGDSKRLEGVVQQFEATASLFDGIWEDLSFDGPPEWPISSVVPSPQDMAKYLRYYRYINCVPPLFAAMNVRSTRDIERHLPTAYVKAATEDWHDREVSALISVATDSNLDEGTHRLWRNRSFAQIAFRPEIIWQLAEIVAEGHYKTG